MSVIEKLVKLFPSEVYPAINDSTSELYKFVYGIAAELETLYDAIANLKDQYTFSDGSGYCLEILGNSHGLDKFYGETETDYKKRVIATFGMHKPTLNGLAHIVNLFCLEPCTITEEGNALIKISIPAASTWPAYYFWTIGTDGSYGSSIGDTYPESAGAIYEDVHSSVTVSTTYLENLVAEVKPAGTFVEYEYVS